MPDEKPAPKTTHTPGPWEDSALPGVKIFAGNMCICDIRGWGYLTGSGGLGLDDDQAYEIQKANARLIAAAPDLLACCKAALAAFERNDAMDWSDLERAILKSEGGA